MKQINLFGSEEGKEGGVDNFYTKKIEAPIYEPRHIKPHILELYDTKKTKRLIIDIKKSNLPEEEKEFLINAARRHTVFNYEKIADYYAHSGKEMQELMERSALIIIDFERAIELGYIKVCENISKEYLEIYGNEK